MKNVPKFTPMATIGVPTICMILLFLLPFYDRSPERRIERRPVALAAGIATIVGDGLPDLPGREHRVAELRRHEAAGGPRPPQSADVRTPARTSSAQSGCLACHVIGDNGNNGPGPPLTHIGSKLAAGRDRLDAAQPDRADAVVQGPGPELPAEVQEPRRLPVRAAVGQRPGARDRERIHCAGRRARHPGGGAGPGDVRPDRRAVRPDEHGHDRGAAPPVAPPRGRPGGAVARATARWTSRPAPATWRSSWPGGSVPAERWSATDFSERMLELARAKASARAAGAPHVVIRPANALDLPFDDGEFDAATVGFGARNFSDLERGLREMARVVRPGGRVVVLEITTPQKPPLSLFFELWFDRIVPALGRLAGDAQAYSYLPNSVRRFPGPRRARRDDVALWPAADSLRAHGRRHHRAARGGVVR